MIPFKPKVTYDDMYYFFHGLEERWIRDTGLHALVAELTSKAVPSSQDDMDTIWNGFYLPLRMSGRRITTRVGVAEYQGKFFVYFDRFGAMRVESGEEENDQIYTTLIEEALRLVPFLKESDNSIVKRTTPYDLRTGKVLGRHVLDDVISQEEKEEHLSAYAAHEAKGLTCDGVSLDDYLDTAAICYRAAFPDQTRGRSVDEMHTRWADDRHGGMLDIEDTSSKEEFRAWQESGKVQGCYPHEIVFSYSNYGISLRPPDSFNDKYFLSLGDLSLADEYVKMVRALIAEEIPFSAGGPEEDDCEGDCPEEEDPEVDGFLGGGLAEVLDFIAGDAYLPVNRRFCKESWDYYPSAEYKRKYFHHIEWDPLAVLKWK